MPNSKEIKYLEDAIYEVLGSAPGRKTSHNWVNVGINDVKLKNLWKWAGFKTTTDEVVTFVFRANGLKPPKAAYELDQRYLPRKAVLLCREVLVVT